VKIGVAGGELIVRLDAGDDILTSIAAACRNHGIQNAEITGIGSVASPTLAHYRRDTQKFTEKSFDGVYEVASLTGNVALIDGQPVAHCHVVVSDAAMTASAGHLVAGVCSATVELIIQPLESSYAKKFDEEVGLKLWQV
jgi:predicted DNA-binding protein with PD1-like motif